MSSPLPAHAVASAFKLSAADRYTLFLSEVTAYAQVWTLKGADGFVAFKDDDGHECFPFSRVRNLPPRWQIEIGRIVAPNRWRWRYLRNAG